MSKSTTKQSASRKSNLKSATASKAPKQSKQRVKAQKASDDKSKKESRHARKSSQKVQHFLDSTYPLKEKLKRRDYENEKEALQIEVLKLQRWVKECGQKIVILFEGRDAAGKGGTIKRIMEHMNPRGARVVALNKPTEVEKGQWYFQRYVAHLPTEGEIVLFDRSWYNRAGVERVMGFCTPDEYEEYMRTVHLFEEMLIGSGIQLFKYWFSVTRRQQMVRFNERENDPLKQWKLSPMDREAVHNWDAYTRAKLTMFARTDTKKAPWTIIKSDDKKRARINCMRDLLTRLDYDNKNLDVACSPNPLVVRNVIDLATKKNLAQWEGEDPRSK